MSDEPVTELELILAIRTLALREEQALADDLAAALVQASDDIVELIDAVLARYREARR